MNRMHIRSGFEVFGFALLLGANPLAAQSRPLFLFGATGGYSSLRDLDNGGILDAKTGLDLSGGFGIQLNDYLAIRGDLDFASGDVRSTDAAMSGATLDRSFYGADAQIRYPIGHGFLPYVTAGAGVMTLRPTNAADLGDAAKFSGRFGAGFAYELPSKPVDLFVEGATSVYRYGDDLLSVDPPVQVDLAWRAGLQYYIR